MRHALMAVAALLALSARPEFVEKEFSVPGGDYRYVDGAGWEGRRAIVFESVVPCSGRCPWVELELQPGYQYEFTGIVRKDLSPDSVVELALSWYDASGRRLTAAIAKPVNDNEVLPDGWVRYGGKTQIVPVTAVKALLHVYVCHGGKGRAVFDRFTLKRLDANWVGGVHTSAYRNMAKEGEVRFVVPLSHFDALRIPVEELDARFQVVGADGRKRRMPPTAMGADFAELRIDVSELAKGTHPVRFGVRTRERVYGTSQTDFTRVDELPRRRVWIDRRRRLIVDGKPFFMLGMYWRKITRPELEAFTPGPFNTVLPCQDPVREQFDMCAEKGIMMCYPFEHRYDVPGESTNVTRIVKELRDHPALLLWYLNDERPESLAGQVKERHDLILSLDDQHPTWSVTDKPFSLRSFLGTSDIFGTDPYPIGRATKRHPCPIERVANDALVARERTFGLCPMWNVPQAFDWGWFRKADRDLFLDVRYPTHEELRQMTWQHIACGANGIMYYAFCALRDYFKGAEFDERWNELKEVAGEVKRYENVFLADEDAPSAASDNRLVPARAWKFGGEAWLLAVNATREPQKAAVTVDARLADGMSAAFGPLPARDGGKFVYSLKPLECSFARIPLERRGGN